MRAASASLGAVEKPSKEEGDGADASSPSAARAMEARRRGDGVKAPTSARVEAGRRTTRADGARATRAETRAAREVARRVIVGVAACIGRARAGVTMARGAMVGESFVESVGDDVVEPRRAFLWLRFLLYRRGLCRVKVALIERERDAEVSVEVGVDEASRAVRDGHALVVQNRANDILSVRESVRDGG